MKQIVCGYCTKLILKEDELFAMICLPKILCFRHKNCLPTKRFFPNKGEPGYINLLHRRGFPAVNSKFYFLRITLLCLLSTLFFNILFFKFAVKSWIFPAFITSLIYLLLIFPYLFFRCKYGNYFSKASKTFKFRQNSFES